MLTMLDIVALLLVAGCAIMGFLRGFVTEMLSLVAWVAAIAALKLFATPFAAMLTGIVGTRGGAVVLSFALIFLITYFLGKVVATAIGRRTRTSLLGPVDRVLGLGFGGLKGLLAATMIFLAINLGYDFLWGANSVRPDWIARSRTYPLLNASGRSIVDWVETRRHAGGVVGGAPATSDTANAAQDR